ncbi:MAG: DUF116 domain-containing protein [Bacteroidales bacterium]|nr:DUF116 domain-containing protein [Bacteroidales bacterium]
MGLQISNLNAGEEFGKSFHDDLTKTTDEMLNCLYSDPLSVQIKEFYNYILKNNIETPRSIEEYFVEYIMIGLYWRNYATYASGLSGMTKKIADVLYNIQSISPVLKPSIEKIRGKIASKRLLKQDNSYELIPIVENFDRLIDWLNASKYFIHERNRLVNWSTFLKQKSPIYVSNFLNGTKEMSRRFIEISKSHLGIYTTGTESFIHMAKADYKNREDIIYITRPEEDYYLNMFGVEILNRSNEHKFSKTIRKIVVLPECMAAPNSKDCKTKISKNTQADNRKCTPECTANNIKRKLDKHGIEMIITEPQTSFSHYIKQWEKHPKVGIVAVGCVLSSLSKFYEMLELGIPSQCVFLDNEGCLKHWPSKNDTKTLNQEVLFGKLNIVKNKISNLDYILN